MGTVRMKLSKILTRECGMVINLPILKDHTMAGVTFAMKNMYGVIDRPQDLHNNNCNPAIADLNCFPTIRAKMRLIIGDAFSSVYEGGPVYHPEHIWYPNALIVGEDRVAIDQIAWQMIARKRAEAGVPTLEAAAVRHITLPRLPMQRTTWAPTIRGAFILWKFEREKQHGRGNRSKAGGDNGGAQGMTRREAMLQLLRLGGAAAGATGAAAWLSEHSFRRFRRRPKRCGTTIALRLIRNGRI